MRNGASVRAVIDTNVLLSGLLWRAAPHDLLEQVRSGKLMLASSSALMAELADVIGRVKFDTILARSNTSRERTLDEVRRLAEVVKPPPLPEPVCRDPDDDYVLALAIAAPVDFIVSGDDDLLSLNQYQGIPIVSPAEALHRIKTSWAISISRGRREAADPRHGLPFVCVDRRPRTDRPR